MSTAIEQITPSLNLPRRRGKAASTLELESHILTIVNERKPITVRGVCYALFTRGLIADMSIGSTQKISRVMTEMRECGTLDWTHIVDGVRVVERQSRWDSTSALINAAVQQYRRDYWQDQPTLVELWSEKSTVQGVLAPVLQEFGVTFRVMKGFGSFTAVRQAAEDSLYVDRPAVALYLGDWDPSGLYMSDADLPRRLERYGSAWNFERIALCREDLDQLPSFRTDSKANDARVQWYMKHTTADPLRCWELDAMDPNELRERVSDAILSYIDAAAWNHAIRIEREEVASMRQFHAAWNARLGGDHGERSE